MNMSLVKIIVISTILAGTPLVSSCSNNDSDSRPLQVDIDTIIQLPDPFLRIKNDYYHQLFEQKSIKYESQANYDGFRTRTAKYDYPINSNSLYIYDFYGVFDGYYCVDFLINGSGAAIWNTVVNYSVKGMEFSTFNYFPPVFWKDGIIYQLDEMNDKEVDLSSLASALSIRKCLYTFNDSRTIDDIFEEPTLQINFMQFEYNQNCPPNVRVPD